MPPIINGKYCTSCMVCFCFAIFVTPKCFRPKDPSILAKGSLKNLKKLIGVTVFGKTESINKKACATELTD